MGNDVIQAKYDLLDQLAARFGQQAEAAAQTRQRVQQSMQPLQQGGWQGRGSAAFFAEMSGELLPAVQRLTAALGQARTATMQARDIMRAAEEEASRPFRSDGAVDAPLDGSDRADGGAAGGGSTAVPSPVDTSQLFSDPYMDQMVGLQIQGSDSQALNQAMETLAGNPTDEQREQALDQIAQARGMTGEEVRAQYARFQQMQAEAARTAAAKGLEASPPVNQFLHDRFMGSTTQLRYGKVVGDALGLDPVFGALLNPSGGLVGPGNAAVDLGESPVGYHGVFHDAAGYLYNYHDMGPGYNYLGREDRDTSSPFTGQESGIRYWNDKMDAGFFESALSNTAGSLIGVGQDVSSAVSGAIDTVGDVASDVVDAVGDAAGAVGDWFGGLFD